MHCVQKSFKSIILTFYCLPFSGRTERYKCRKAKKTCTKEEMSAAVFMLGFDRQIIRVWPAFNQWGGLVKFCWSLTCSVMKTHELMVNVVMEKSLGLYCKSQVTPIQKYKTKNKCLWWRTDWTHTKETVKTFLKCEHLTSCKLLKQTLRFT